MYSAIRQMDVATPLPKAIVARRPVPPSASSNAPRRLASIQRNSRTPNPKTIPPATRALSFASTHATNAAVSLPSGQSSFSSRIVPTIQRVTAPSPVSGA
jgi:hypothetical protein